MKKEIIPSIIAKNQKELNIQISRLSKSFSKFHLDVMDGKFVNNYSLDFKIETWVKKRNLEAHLMIKNPAGWIKENKKSVGKVIVHIETLKKNEIKKIIKETKKLKLRIFLALNPKTRVYRVKPYLDEIDGVMFMTVNPGKYGSPFILDVLGKIKKLREINQRIKIEADGGINKDTIKQLSDLRVNIFVVGSYFQKSKNLNKSKNALENLIK